MPPSLDLCDLLSLNHDRTSFAKLEAQRIQWSGLTKQSDNSCKVELEPWNNKMGYKIIYNLLKTRFSILFVPRLNQYKREERSVILMSITNTRYTKLLLLHIY